MAFRNDPHTIDETVPWSRAGDAILSTDLTAPPFLLPWPVSQLVARALVATAPTGADLIADVHLDGVTAFTTQANRPTILAAETDSGAWAVPDIVAAPAGTVVTVNVDQVGSTLPGTALTVQVRFRRRL